MANPLVLVVDDNKEQCDILVDALSPHFDVSVSHEGADALQSCQNRVPDVILMDIGLPQDDGFSVCKNLSSLLPDKPFVIFISGDDSIDQKMKAYESGGDDFIPKPFKIQELQAKVEKFTQFRENQKQQKAQHAQSNQVAMTAMIEAAQYGEVLRFYNALFRSQNIYDVVNAFFKLMASLNLKTSIQFRMFETISMDSRQEPCSPIEENIFEHFNSSERLVSFSNKLLVNDRHVSFIVKNMPVDDEVTFGRLRDILAVIVEGLESKTMDMMRVDLLLQTSDDIAQTCQRLENVTQKQERSLNEAMNTIIAEINSSFHHLEMTEVQESFFTSLAENALKISNENYSAITDEQERLHCSWTALQTMLKHSKSTSKK